MNFLVPERPQLRRAFPTMLVALVFIVTLVLIPLSVQASANQDSPAQQPGALTGCENIPAGTLRIINHNDVRTSVSRSDGSSFAMAPGEVRDVVGVAGQSWEGAHISGTSANRMRYVVPASGIGCMIMGTPQPPPQLPDLAQCQDIPAGPYGSVTLRIVNFHPYAVTIHEPDVSKTFTLESNQSRDVVTSAGLMWSYRDPGQASTIIWAHRAARAAVDCWVLGDPNAPTPTPVPLPDIPECKDIPDSVNGSSTLRIINFLSYPVLIEEPNGSRWELGVGETAELDPVDPGGEWWAHPGIAGAIRWRYVVPTGGRGCFVIGTPGAAPAATQPAPLASPTFDIPTPTATATALPPATATPAASPTPPAEYISLQSYNFPDLFARHGGFVYYLSAIENEVDQQDATFRVRPGLADSSLLSLESVNFTNHFVTVENGSVVLRERPAGDTAFDANSTFVRHPGLADPAAISLESSTTPGSYIRHSSLQLLMQPSDGSDLFNADGTFYQSAPKWTGPAAPEATAVAPEATAASPEATAAAPEATAAAPEATAAAPEATAAAPEATAAAPEATAAAPEATAAAPEATAVAPEATAAAPEATAAPTEIPTEAPTLAPTEAPTVAPTVAPTPTPEAKTACTQEDFIKAIKDGEASGTVTLDGTCHYKLTSASDTWSGGNGAFLFNAKVIEGNGAIIERDAAAPKFRILAVQAPNIVVRNLTIRNGNTTGAGAGIYIITGGTLENVTLENNTTTGSGGAIASQGVTVLRNVTATGNSAKQGGGIYNFNNDLSIDNSRFINNRATDAGGAIAAQNAIKLDVTDTLFAQNRADKFSGASIFFNSGGKPDSRIINSTFTDNTLNPGAAITHWSPLMLRNNIIANHATGVEALGATITVNEDYNLFSGNTTNVKALNNATMVAGANSVFAPDPQFVDAAALNYAIKKSSPAADRGDSSVLNLTTALAIDGANQPRPYSGSPVDIGAYELQELGGASISISKVGPHWITTTVPVTFTLEIANNGVAPGNQLVVVDVLPQGATYVEGSASSGGVHANGRVTWNIATLAPGNTQEVAYSVMATQTLVSNDYTVSSTSDPSILFAGKVITTPLNSNLVTKFGFFPFPDGYSFQNYGDDGEMQKDLSVDDMVYIFGKEVVCKVQTGACVLTATANNWRNSWLKTLAGGHCVGFAIGSLSIYANPNVDASDFQSQTDVTFDLTKADSRQHIAIFAATQGSQPANHAALSASGVNWYPAEELITSRGKSVWSTSPITVFNLLTTNLANLDATERYRINIRLYPPRPGVDGGGGHAMTPYAVSRIAGDDYYIHVYDNNYPNDFTRAIKINQKSGAWSYVGTTNPSQPTETYRGDLNSNNLKLTSLTWAAAFPKECAEICPPGYKPPTTTSTGSAGPTAGATPFAAGVVQVQLSGEGNPLVTRSDGAKVGFDPVTGEWINEIEGAQAVDLLFGLGLNTPPAIQIPYEAGMTYDVDISPRETAFGNDVASVNLNVFSPGFSVSVNDLTLTTPLPQPVDAVVEGAENAAEATSEGGATTPALDLTAITIDPDQNRVVVQPGDDAGETPSLVLAVSQADGSDFTVNINEAAIEPGNALALGFDAATQSVQIESDSDADSTWQVELNRVNLDGTQDTFVSDALSSDGNPGVSLIVGDEWDGTGEPATQPITEPTLIVPAPEEAPAGDDTAEASADAPAAVEQFFTLCDASDVPDATSSDVMLRVVNASGVDATLYWRNDNGELLPYNELAPNASVDQETYTGHTWVAMDGSGATLLQYTATAEPQQCVQLQLP